MFILIPKNVTSERPIALLPTVIRWWEGLWVQEVTRWQERHRVGWDATDGRNGGVERTVWEALLEMNRFDYRAAEKDQGTITWVLDFDQCNRARQSPSCAGLGDTFQLHQEYFVCAVRVLRIPAECAVRRMRGGAAPDHHRHSPWVKVELLALARCVAGRSE